MSRKVWAVLVSTVVLAASCSEPVPVAPTAVEQEGSPATVAPSCPSATDIQNLIKALYPDGKAEATALGKFTEIQKKVAQGKTSDAVAKMFDLLDQTLKLFAANKLTGGKTAATQGRVVDLTNALYCFVGLSAPAISTAALGPDAAVAVVYPTSSDTLIKTGTGWAAVRIPSGAVPDGQPVLVTLERIPESSYPTPYSGPLATGLNQYPLFYEYSVSPVVTFDVDVTVSICLLDQIDLTTPGQFGSRLRVAHNISPTTIEILPWATPAPLDCSSIELAGLGTSSGVFAARSGLPGLFQAGLARTVGWLLPARLEAASPSPMGPRTGTCCLGGSTREFSPFGGVDTLGFLTAQTSQAQTAPANTPVAQAPAVKITGDPALGAKPIAGIPVTFTVTAGTGTINGGPGPVVVTTNASGIAALSSWVIGTGYNQVLAAPQYVPRSGFTPTSLTFEASDNPVCVAQSEIPLLECLALADLYTSTAGASWITNTGWMATATPCSWHGVTCVSGRVTVLRLPANNLSGPLPASLGNLGALVVLHLGDLTSPVKNHLTGSIPTSLGGLTSLQELDLRGNQLTGSIPTALGNLTALRRLWLQRNLLTGTIPSSLASLTSLDSLSLSANGLTGGIPAWIGGLTSLRYLSLCENPLGGSIPAELGNLANLRFLCLIMNQHTGTIPAELGNLDALEEMYLWRNQLTGTIPKELGNLAQIRYLHLWGNQLSGSIPAELGNLSTLQSLWLAQNQLSGEIPASLGGLPGLISLVLDDNLLSGTVPLSVAQKGGLIQSLYGVNSCALGNNPGLHIPEQPAYRAADLNTDGLICGLAFTTVETVEVTPSSYSLSVGGTVQLAAILRDIYGNVLSGPVIVWSSSAAAVASVNSSGLVSALASGTTGVIATSQGKSGSASITVTSP